MNTLETKPTPSCNRKMPVTVLRIGSALAFTSLALSLVWKMHAGGSISLVGYLFGLFAFGGIALNPRNWLG